MTGYEKKARRVWDQQLLKSMFLHDYHCIKENKENSKGRNMLSMEFYDQ